MTDSWKPPLQRKVRSLNSDRWIDCLWCRMHGFNKPGYELYKTVLHEHAPELQCDHPLSEHINYVFCSERHRQYFLHSHIDMGNLPAGHKSTIH